MKHIGFYIDKVTECIEEIATGAVHDTDIIPATAQSLKEVLKKNGWNFLWKSYLKKSERHVYQLIIRGDPAQRIQGLLSIEIMENYVELHHIENAPHNFGVDKEYAGVAGNLVAFACKLSWELKFEGFVAFKAKSALTKHYQETLGAQFINPRQNRMAIFPEASKKLVNSYYKQQQDNG